MTKIKYGIDKINEELDEAKMYAECYVECKARNNMSRAGKYQEMSKDNLRHANYLHDMTLEDIDELERVLKPTEEMKKMWTESHSKYVEKTAWIKQMLAM